MCGSTRWKMRLTCCQGIQFDIDLEEGRLISTAALKGMENIAHKAFFLQLLADEVHHEQLTGVVLLSAAEG